MKTTNTQNNMSSVHHVFTLSQCMTQLNNQHYMLNRILERVDAQVLAIRRLADSANEKNVRFDFSVLAGIAVELVEPYLELMEDIDDTMGQVNRRLFCQPEEGAMLPESGWLNLVEVLAAQRNEFSNDDMWKLAEIDTMLHGYAATSPEVGAAVTCLEAFAERHGARLLPNNPSSGSSTFNWLPGYAPHERKKPSGAK